MRLVAAAAMLTAAALPAWAQQAQTFSVEDFIRSAIQDGMADVEIGRMSRSDPATPQAVQEVGRSVAETSLRLNDGLTRLAEQHKVVVANQLEPQDRTVIQQLSKIQGQDFNRQYLQYVIGDLEGNIRMYKRAAEADSGGVRQFAQEALPQLESTLAKAREVQNQQTAEEPAVR